MSGMSDMDYPLQGPGLLSIPNLPEISSVRRVPLPPELVEQFGRILMETNVSDCVRSNVRKKCLSSIFSFPNPFVRLAAKHFSVVLLITVSGNKVHLCRVVGGIGF